MTIPLKTLQILATIGVLSIIIWVALIFDKLCSWLRKKGLVKVEQTEKGYDIKLFEKKENATNKK